MHFLCGIFYLRGPQRTTKKCELLRDFFILRAYFTECSCTLHVHDLNKSVQYARLWRSALNEAWFTTPHFAPGNSAFIVPTTSAHTTFTAVPKTHRHRRWVNPSGGYLLLIWAPGVRFFLTFTKGTPHVCLQNRLPAGTGHRSAGRPQLYEPADTPTVLTPTPRLEKAAQ